MIWNIFFNIIYYTLTYGIFLYSLLLSISFIFLGLFSIGETKDYLHKNQFTDYRLLASSEHVPSVSILAPAYNEGKTNKSPVTNTFSISIAIPGKKRPCIGIAIFYFQYFFWCMFIKMVAGSIL